MCPFHRLQSFRNRLLLCESPAGSQVLAADLLQCGLLSPQGHRSCQESAPAWASHTVMAFFRCIHLIQRGVPFAGYRWISAPLCTSMGCRWTACLMMVFMVSGGSILKLAGISSIGHRESFCCLLTGTTPVAPLLSKPCHINPVQKPSQVMTHDW